MEDEEFERLIQLVSSLLRDHGLSEIAAESNFVELLDSDGVRRIMEPQKRLVALLEAFDVHLMLNDSNVVRRSLDLIAEQCEGRGPDSAVVVRPVDRGRSQTESLISYPDLRKLRSTLRSLINGLRETPRGGGSEGVGLR